MKIFKLNIVLFYILTISFIFLAVYSPVSAQNWIALPPYNTLWPLWSPALSPVNDVTGLPVPIVDSLASDVVLPVMPGLTWDPSLSYPWLLYNTFSGLTYFDPLAGINLWPAPSLLDNTGSPSPIALPPGYADLPPTSASWLSPYVPIANNSYILSYQSFLPLLAGPPGITSPPPLTSLLTPLDILGPVLGAPSVLAPPQTLPPAPIPAPPLPVSPLATGLAPTVPVIAEQAGTWIGRWYEAVGFLFGDMTMVIVENSPGVLSGIVTLYGNLLVPLPTDITGSLIAGAAVQLSGVDPTFTYSLELNGILTSPTVMTGTWMVIDLKTGLLAKDGTGTFSLDLLNPILAPAATTVTPIAVASTVVAPLLPPPTAPIPAIAPLTVAPPAAAISQLVPLSPFPIAIAEQVGTWEGVWSAALTSGPMYLNLGEVIDPVTGITTLIGYTQLLGNPWLGVLIDNLEGDILNNQIYVTGSGIGAGNTNYTIEIVGTILTSTTMTGVYTLIGTANSIKEVGSFDLNLLPPII